MLCGSDEGGTAGRAKYNGGLQTLHKNGGLDGANRGVELFDDVIELLPNGNQTARGEEFGRIGDGAISERPQFSAAGFDDGISCLAQSRVNGEHALWFGGVHRSVAVWRLFPPAGADAKKLVERDGPGTKQGQRESR